MDIRSRGGEYAFNQELGEPVDYSKEYETLHRLITRLDVFIYSESEELKAEEVDELIDTVTDMLDRDPGLQHIFSEKAYMDTWKKISKIMYKQVRKSDSAEHVQQLSTLLGKVIGVANPETNKGPADSIVFSLYQKLPWGEVKGRSKETYASRIDEGILSEYLSSLGLDAKKVVQMWYASNQSVDVGSMISHVEESTHPIKTAYGNMLEMRRLELQAPGGPKKLVEDFGVYCFRRYPKGMLDDQLKYIDDVDTPYGTMIVSIGDHDGALYVARGSRKALLDQARDQGVRIRVVEVTNKIDLIRKMMHLEKTYNDPGKQKAAWGIIEGHSNETAIDFGVDGSSISTISMEDVSSESFGKAAQRFFEDGATIVVNGCSVGKNKGIAQEASAHMPGLRIVASPGNVSGVSYELHADGQMPPTLTASYRTMTVPFLRDMNTYEQGVKTSPRA